MKTPLIAILLAISICIFVPIEQAVGQGAPIRVLMSNGMKGAMEELQPACERAIAHPLAVEYSSTAGVKKRIEGGQGFDVTVITTEAIAALSQEGKVRGESRVDLGRSRLGIGIRAGASRPDIKTEEALKQTLRKARSITYPQDGATRAFIEEMFERTGIAADIKPKITLAEGSTAAALSVANGQMEMVITLFSEIMPVKGLEVLGPLPGSFQNEVKFAAAVSTSAQDPQAARSLITFLRGPQARAIFTAKGIEPVK